MTPALLASLRAGFVPGDAVPGLLDGWTGPVEADCGFGVGWLPGVWFNERLIRSLPPWHDRRPPAIRIPLSRPECRQRVATVMGAGLRCEPLLGRGTTTGNWTDPLCPSCRGTGHLRPPAPARHLLPVSELGDLPDALAEHSWALLACHVARVLAGLSPVRGVIQRRRAFIRGPGWIGGHGYMVSAEAWLYRRRLRGWEVREIGASGPETGPAGMAAADRASLLAGFALHHADGMVLPWPDVSP